MEQAPSPRGFDLRELPRRTVLIAAGVLLLVVVLGAIALSGGFSKYSLKGTLTVYEAVGSGACTGTGGFDDIHLGAPVTVRDGSGKILALGSLDAGRVAGGASCRFPFAMTVPDSDFYSVEVSHRGEVSFSKADMQAVGWSVALTLGP